MARRRGNRGATAARGWGGDAAGAARRRGDSDAAAAARRETRVRARASARAGGEQRLAHRAGLAGQAARRVLVEAMQVGSMEEARQHVAEAKELKGFYPKVARSSR